MPRTQKMHPKPRAPPTNIQKHVGDEGDTEEMTRTFELELCWCIQQLERVLAEKKLNEKQLTDSWKVLQVLKNNSQPLVRKRQLMRTHFGNYREKMAAEEKKLVKMATSIKIEQSPSNPKATFIRRSAFLTTGDNSFRFNFEPLAKNSTNELQEEKSADQEGDTNMRHIGRENDKTAPVRDAKTFKFSFTDKPFIFNFADKVDK